MTIYRFGGREVDLATRELRVDGELVAVEPQVFDVLSYLVVHRDRLISKSELLEQVWGNQFVSESALTSRIKSARSAIGDDGAAQLMIRTQRGRGYRFVGPVQVIEEAAARAGAPVRAMVGLPASPRTRLVGRERELASIGALLDRHRLVTISGPGGVGKSTLALELARQRLDGPGLQVAFVELAPARSNAEVVRAVAEATGLEGPAASSGAALAATLGARPLLLVLDNCEHLLAASAELVDAILDAGAAAQILTTSREPLGSAGEAVYPLGSLGRDAATLFVERAAAAGAQTRLVASDPAVAELCRRLDGLPLAIELAAAQTRHLSLPELASKLDERLGILAGGRPRAGPRHAALAATVEWSYQLLSAPARELFDRLGVFPASFDLPAAEAVGTGPDPVATVNLVGDLVAKSLVGYDPATGRYRLLETIRLFAAGRLRASGRHAEVTGRLRRHIAARTAGWTRSQVWLSPAWAARSRADIENVRTAFEASVAAGELGEAIDIMLTLSTLWRDAVSYAEGRRWVAHLRDQPLAAPDRIWLHIVEADLGLGSGEPRLMVDAAAAAIALGPQAHDPAAGVIAQIYRSLLVRHPRQAAAGLAAARDQARAAGEPALERLARAYRVVALLAAGQRDGLDHQLRDLTSEPTDSYERYICLWAAWVTALVDRDGRALRRWMDVQLDNVRSSGLPENWVTMFCHALTRIGEGARYLPHLRQARRRAEAEGRQADADCVFALAYAAACGDRPADAAELIGASAGRLFHDTANFVHHLLVRDLVVRPQLDPVRFDEAMERGRRRSIPQILSEHGL